jgi:hypothetical protein
MQGVARRWYRQDEGLFIFGAPWTAATAEVGINVTSELGFRLNDTLGPCGLSDSATPVQECQSQASQVRYVLSVQSPTAGSGSMATALPPVLLLVRGDQAKLEAVVEPAQPREKSTASPDCGRSRP